MDATQFERSAIGGDATVRDDFLDALRATGSVAAAVDRTGVARSTLYRTRRRIPDFAAAWDAILGVEADRLEAAVLDRAINGVERKKYAGGKVVERWREYSDALAIFLLKARLPEVYASGAVKGKLVEARPPMGADEFLAAIATMPRTADLAPED